MFQAIDPDFLLTLRLLGTESTPHAGRECRLASLRAADNEVDVLAEVAPLRADGRSVVVEQGHELTLRDVARRYRVDRSEGTAPLAAILEERCSNLVSNWPCRGQGRGFEGGLVLAVLLSPARPIQSLPDHLQTWCKDALGLLRLDACLAEAPPGQTAPEFFEQLAGRLEADRQRWEQGPEEARGSRLSAARRLQPAPKPVSLLTSLQRAGTEAEARAALKETESGRLRFHLEAALDQHWMRVCRQTALLKELFSESPAVARVEARIAVAADQPRDPELAQVELEFEGAQFELRIGVPFYGPPADGPQARLFHVCLFIRGERPRRTPKKVPPRFANRLQVHLNDMRWSLDRYCRDFARLPLHGAPPESALLDGRRAQPGGPAGEPGARDLRAASNGPSSAKGERRERPETRRPDGRPLPPDTGKDSAVTTISVYHPERQVEKITLRTVSAVREQVELTLCVVPPEADVEIEGSPIQLNQEGTIVIRGNSGQTIHVRARCAGYREVQEGIKLSNTCRRIRLARAR